MNIININMRFFSQFEFNSHSEYIKGFNSFIEFFKELKISQYYHVIDLGKIETYCGTYFGGDSEYNILVGVCGLWAISSVGFLIYNHNTVSVSRNGKYLLKSSILEEDKKEYHILTSRTPEEFDTRYLILTSGREEREESRRPSSEIEGEREEREVSRRPSSIEREIEEREQLIAEREARMQEIEEENRMIEELLGRLVPVTRRAQRAYADDRSRPREWKSEERGGPHDRRNGGQEIRRPKSADLPLAWALYFQDGASPSFEGIVDLHNRIMFYLVVILFGVTWIMLSLMWNYNKSENRLVYRHLNHGTLIELIWTVGPALVLVAIAFPSFKLLYLMDEVVDPAMTLKVTGHQWYWEYEYADFLNEENDTINFDSYMIDEASLEKGELRLLEVDNPVVLPIDTHIRFIITGADVIHDWAVPALALKVDACPGRLNQASVIIERKGSFYGQCSEICGVLHSSMPIKIEAVDVEKFFSWLLEQ